MIKGRRQLALKHKHVLAAGVSPLRASMATSAGAETNLGQSNTSLLKVTSQQMMDQYPAMNFKSNQNDAIKVLDNMIQVEE